MPNTNVSLNLTIYFTSKTRNAISSNLSQFWKFTKDLKFYPPIPSLIHIHDESAFSSVVSISLNSTSILIGSIYLSPLSPLPLVTESHLSCVDHLLTTLKPNAVILCSDYNIPHVSWSSDDFGLTASGCLSPLSTEIVNSFSFTNFFQLIYCFNSSGNTLDLVFF